jgi:hypothetical protein
MSIHEIYIQNFVSGEEYIVPLTENDIANMVVVYETLKRFKPYDRYTVIVR